MSKNPYLSVVVPAYNEENNLKRGVLDNVFDYLKIQKYDWEVLIVNDGSKDKTSTICHSYAQNHPGFRVLDEPHRGKGGTVVAGMLASTGEIVLFSDLDQATPIDQLEKVLPKFEKGYDVVIGKRSGRKGAPLSRKIMAYGFMVLRTIILRLPINDTQCGFKGFRRSTIQPIFGRLRDSWYGSTTGSAVNAGFDVELLYIARKLGYKIAEVDVFWEEKGDRGKSGVSPIKDSYQGLRDLIRVRINSISGKYKI